MESRISFREVNFKKDAELLYKWMNEEHVIPFWKLNGPRNNYYRHLEKALADSHQTLYIGCINDKPMSYWEAYWVKGDVVENVYPSAPFDQGIHLLIGEKDDLGKGYSLPLLKAMVRHQFEEPGTEKVIAEPDIRNEKMIHVFEKCGFRAIQPIELPDKTALLMFCRKDEFYRRWGCSDKERAQTHL
ncbi:GNAT family N-acetyltransferase [Fictibacillus fluitans]|uniref:GNAT family N-acetyltransferase n=1 Tax=Fictibacillus fluitans TaxID=3058422 RepID=UPI003CD0CB4F